MIYVEGGTFTMGSDAGSGTAGTQRANQAHEHQVTLSSYWIGETEVTIALWNAVMGSGGGSNTTPVASITRNQSVEFARRLNDIAHKQGLIPDDMNFQIPTEAQWEFAAKGGNQKQRVPLFRQQYVIANRLDKQRRRYSCGQAEAAQRTRYLRHER